MTFTAPLIAPGEWLSLMRDELSELHEVAISGGPLGLAEGPAGASLAMAECGYATSDRSTIEAAGQSARLALETALDSEGDLGLFTGLAGIAFADLRIHAILGSEDRSLHHATLLALHDGLHRRSDTLDVDLVHGVAGIAIYLAQLPEEPRAVRLLHIVIELLESRASASGECCWWETPPERVSEWRRQSFPHGYIDLAVAHGSAGIAGALALVSERVPSVDAAHLLRRVVAHLLDLAPSGGFPAFIDLKSRAAAPGRSSWCYGELASALCIARALRALGTPHAQRCIREHYADAHVSVSDVSDTGLCHGHAGMAVLLASARGAFLGSRDAALEECQRRVRSAWRSVTLKGGLLDGRAGLILMPGTIDTNATGWRDLFLVEHWTDT